MRNWLILFVCLCMVAPATAAHLKGGWIQYKYIGPGAAANSSRYEITVRQYMDCGSTSDQRDNIIYLGVFNSKTGALVNNISIPRSGTDNPNKTTFSPCISSPPQVC